MALRIVKSQHHHAHAIQGKPQIKKGPDVALKSLYKEWTSTKCAERIVEKYGQEKLERMLTACNNIIQLSDSLGLKKKELFHIVEFIEERGKKGPAYLRKEKTHLARTIEFASNRAFIHLKTHGVSAIRDGKNKTGTLSILYDVEKPELVANYVGKATVRHEARVVKKLHNADGTIKTYAVGSHKKRSGEKVHSLITKLYNAGSLRTYELNLAKATPDEKLAIARDLIKGLQSLQKKNISHGSLHSSQLLVHKDPATDKVSACISGFRKSSSWQKAKTLQGDVPYRFLSPDALVHKGKNDKELEKYALGCSLYSLHFGKKPEWCAKIEKLNIKKLSKKKKAKLSRKLKGKLRKTINKQKHAIAKDPSAQKKLGKLVLKLLDPSASKRIGLSQALKLLKS